MVTGGRQRWRPKFFRNQRVNTDAAAPGSRTGKLMNHMPSENHDRADLMQIRLMFGSIVGCLLVMTMTIVWLSTGIA